MPILPILSGENADLVWAAGSSGRFRGKEYFEKLNANEKARFDALFKRMAATGSIKWGMPMFATTGMVCYFRAQKEYVRFGFPVRGVTLADPRGVLYGEGDGKHLRIDRVEEIDAKRITSWIKAVAKHVAAAEA